MTKLICDLKGWPNTNYGPPAVENNKNISTETRCRDVGHRRSSARRSFNFDKCAYIIAYMHDLRSLETPPCRFFTASPDVCGEAASLTAGVIDHMNREKNQMRLTLRCQ